VTAETATLRRTTVLGGGASVGGDAAEQGYYDPVTASWTIKVMPGRFHITARADEVIVTVLGSCVSACIRDVETGVGGMNHFMLASDAYLVDFVKKMTEMTRGKAYFANPNNLTQFVLMDFLKRRTSRVK